jgi:dTMP kinase
MRGNFISIEGIDGAGKSSHVEGIVQWFRARGREVLHTREPGGTPLAESLRSLVLHEPMDPLSEALLVFAGRRDHVQRVIEPALAAGKVVVCDRFSDATFAYQGGGRGFDWPLLQTLEQWVHPGLNPELTFWFDLDPAVAARRRAAARDPDRFEALDVDFFARVRQGYARRAEADASRFARIDAERTVHEVWDQIEAVLAARMAPATRQDTHD